MPYGSLLIRRLTSMASKPRDSSNRFLAVQTQCGGSGPHNDLPTQEEGWKGWVVRAREQPPDRVLDLPAVPLHVRMSVFS